MAQQGIVGDTCPLARATHALSEARSLLCLPGASRESPLLLHLGRAAKAGSAGSLCFSAGWQARVSVRDPGKPGWLPLLD